LLLYCFIASPAALLLYLLYYFTCFTASPAVRLHSSIEAEESSGYSATATLLYCITALLLHYCSLALC
jgi:hypothetical protein